MSHQQQHQIEIQTTSDHESSVPSPCNSISSLSVSFSVSSLSNLLFSERTSPDNSSCFHCKTYNYRRRRLKSLFHDSSCTSVTPRPSWNKFKNWFGSFTLMASQDDLMVHDPVQFVSSSL